MSRPIKCLVAITGGMFGVGILMTGGSLIAMIGGVLLIMQGMILVWE